jgi:hypothetical protein
VSGEAKKEPLEIGTASTQGLFNSNSKLMIAKIYPNGEASMFFQRRLKRKNLPFEPRRRDRQYEHFLDFKEEYGSAAALEAQNAARRGGRPLGLVTAPISTKTPKTQSGTKGLTRHGARMLRQGAYLIEKRAGKDCVTFATATLPQVSDEELEQIESDWSNIVHRFVKRIRYQLEKKNLPAEVIHVTEVQTKRADNEGREIPHIHLVFQGRRKKQSWAITPKQITKWWKKAVGLKSTNTRTFSSSCQVARVKYSVSRYLSKYVAKSRIQTGESTSQSTLRKLSLKQWWGCTDSLRRNIFRSIRVVSDSSVEYLWRTHEKEDKTVWEYQGTISNPWDGGDIIFCRFGRLTEGARQLYSRRNLGVDKTVNLR